MPTAAAENSATPSLVQSPAQLNGPPHTPGPEESQMDKLCGDVEAVTLQENSWEDEGELVERSLHF